MINIYILNKICSYIISPVSIEIRRHVNIHRKNLLSALYSFISNNSRTMQLTSLNVCQLEENGWTHKPCEIYIMAQILNDLEHFFDNFSFSYIIVNKTISIDDRPLRSFGVKITRKS